jgi:hypothetical protein
MNKLRIWLAAHEKRGRLNLTAGPFWRMEVSGEAKKGDSLKDEVWATRTMRFLMENLMILILTIDG